MSGQVTAPEADPGRSPSVGWPRRDLDQFIAMCALRQCTRHSTLTRIVARRAFLIPSLGHCVRVASRCRRWRTRCPSGPRAADLAQDGPLSAARQHRSLLVIEMGAVAKISCPRIDTVKLSSKGHIGHHYSFIFESLKLITALHPSWFSTSKMGCTIDRLMVVRVAGSSTGAGYRMAIVRSDRIFAIQRTGFSADGSELMARAHRDSHPEQFPTAVGRANRSSGSKIDETIDAAH
ncbi:hypothetical protein WOLCODRAFT_153709 [Wolfiporia cocos MD-104 SS10]|uniref:Uncharacterized protein n=1 Tax=Wolfiporia cocos (strain MD-104) TaxID=742152 RepID=A0A2H3K0N0_WOLCO|nr:hypothetical protein WOLCODRAFT_153709 [Wolfiporia cocos MD-104 SS10]